jgi:hypothetical protein
MALRPEQPADIVIYGSTSALGVLTGVGAAYALWSQLHAGANQVVLAGSVLAAALGMGLIGLALRESPSRLFVLVAAASLAVAFLLGGNAFSALGS